MTSTLKVSQVEVSKQLNDYWSGTTTSTGNSTSLIDTALKAKENDWIGKNTFAMITKSSHTAENEERKISSLDNSTGDCTTLAFGAATDSSTTYEIYRLFTPSEVRTALVYAARAAYPHLHERIQDESLVSHNWLADGSIERWPTTATLTDWDIVTVTATQTSTSPYYKHGTYSCKLDTAAGYLSQDIADWDDLKRLAGQAVTFTAQGWCDTADCLRLAIYDGTDTTYSDHHDGTSDWTTNVEELKVTATIADTPTTVEFRVYHDVDAGTSYVDDCRVMGPWNPRIYIGHLGLAQNKPHQVLIEDTNYSQYEPWTIVRDIDYDTENGYMYLPQTVTRDLRLRVKGIGYLDFLASGVSSTAWTATININSPQLDILVAQAAVYLYTQMSLPNFTMGTRDAYKEMIGYWKGELKDRIGKFGMKTPNATVSWGAL